MLMHAEWGGRAQLDGARVLDAYAGTGALGLEARSRGAAYVTFIEQDRAALAILRGNIAACRAEAEARVIAADVRRPPPGTPCRLVFLDPPYGRALIVQALPALDRAGWLAPRALIVAETGRDEAPVLAATLLAERSFGAAKLSVWRAPG